MAFHLLDRYARDDSIVKSIFDHLRNIGIAAVVFSAAAYKQKHIGSGLVAVWDHISALVLSVVGVALIWINHENLFYKIRNVAGARWIKATFIFIYTVVLIELLKYLEHAKG